MTDRIEKQIQDCLDMAMKEDADGDIYISKPAAIPLIKKLLLSETAKAKYQELADLNWQIAKNDWHDKNYYKMFGYIADRFAELKALANTESNKEGVVVNE